MKIETLSTLDNLLNDRRKEISRLRKEGKKVFGYVCSKIPIEIPHALGMIPIRIGVADESMLEMGARYIHQYTCPYVKCIVAEVLKEGDFFHDNVDVLSGYVTCLAVHRCLEVLKVYTHKPTIYITHPLNPPTKREKKFYEGEVKLFIKKLEEIADRPLDPASLEESVRLFDETRKILKQLYKLESLDGIPMKWTDMLRIIHAGFILDAEQYLEFLKEALKEANANSKQDSDSSPRIMLLGSPILPGDDLLVKTIEMCGGRIIADTLCTGLRSFEDLAVEDPTIDGLIETYLDSNPCATAQDLEVDKDRRLNHILRMIKEYKIEGAIYYALRFCDHYAFKAEETKEFLAEKANIPMLTIHSEYGEAEEGRLRTRIESFLETLKTRKGGNHE